MTFINNSIQSALSARLLLNNKKNNNFENFQRNQISKNQLGQLKGGDDGIINSDMIGPVVGGNGGG